MKPSTVVELLGFACLVAAASVWQTLPLEAVTGLVAAGIALLFIGYATSDPAAEVAIARLVRPMLARRARKKAEKISAKAKKALKAA